MGAGLSGICLGRDSTKTLLTRFEEALIKRSGTEGAEEVLQFVNQHRFEVSKVLGLFEADGQLRGGKPFPASCYNDYYKWTMLPVILATERAYGGDVRCTFSVNIRAEDYRQSLYESASGKGSPDLFNEVKSRLEGLTKRIFDRALFEKCAEENSLPDWGPETIDAVCGPSGAPRTLVQEFKADMDCHEPVAPSEAGGVLVQIFIAPDEKLKQDRVYIEATGPWHRVTWLETSMMQAVYDALFRDKMRKRYSAAKSILGAWDDGCWYGDWLAEAMCRCARSVKASIGSGMKGALFTGRRTGGLALMMLQGMYAQQEFRDSSGGLMLLGSSSATARYMSLEAGVGQELVPKCAGTHAHELSMTLGAILGEEDDRCGMPISQLVGHVLYFYRSLPQGDVREGLRKNLMPMLPDTLGTPAFMRTASKLKVPFGAHKGQPVLDIIGAGRQDSGKLKHFKDTMDKFNFKGAVMASEIEVAQDLTEAAELGFRLFGAGGFMGDSEKAWDSSKPNISMAVKVLRVYVQGKPCPFLPVKTGETEGGTIKEGKFEADGTLPADRLQQVRERAERLAKADAKVSDAELQKLFLDVLQKFMPDAAV